MRKSGESAGDEFYTITVKITNKWNEIVAGDSDGKFAFTVPADVLLAITDSSFYIEASYILSDNG